MSEEKKEIKKYYLGDKELADAGNRTFVEGVTVLVEEVEYKKLAAEIKTLDHILKQKVELIDKKNQQIDQLSDEKQVVPLALFEEEQMRVKIMRAKLKKLGAWGGE